MPCLSLLQMNECCYYILLFVYCLCSSLEQTFAIYSSNVTIQHVCEHQSLTIRCSTEKNETIQIVRSMYGRTSQRICQQDLIQRNFMKTCANIEQSQNETKQRCQGKSSCEIMVNNSIYTDPCGSNIPKHFEVHYRCVNWEKICSDLVNNCSQKKDFKCIRKIQMDYSCSCPSSICEYNQQGDQLIGFVENTCPEENFQGIYWAKTLVNKGRQMPCPYPCSGQIFRFCSEKNHWSNMNTTDCQCPIQRIDRRHHLAQNYLFQCNFWLINRWRTDEQTCIFDTNDQSSSTCLINAFKKISSTSCSTFSMDFQNLAFEIYIPLLNTKKFLLPQVGSNEVLVDRSHPSMPMMLIDMKNSNSSLILIEQSNELNSIQTGNVTVIFNHRSSEIRYQCRAYRSMNASFQFDSSDMFFVCQLLCSNGTHTICQCPFYNPMMHYVLHLDTSISKDDFQYSLIDNDLHDRCSFNQSIDKSLEKLNYYLKNFSAYNQKKSLAKKLLSFMETLIDNEHSWINHLIEPLEFLALELNAMSQSFRFIRNHIEFFVHSNQWENSDGSVMFSSNGKLNGTWFVLSKFDEYVRFNQSSKKINSPIVHYSMSTNLPVTFRHFNVLNTSNEKPICMALNKVWSEDQCVLIASNSTHSICSCNQPTTMAVGIDFHQTSMKISKNRIALISKIISILCIICLILTLITLFIRHSMNLDDDLLIVRRILHINMCICFLIAQFLFFFSIEQIQSKFICRIIAILLHYFLLTTFSWLFVDGIELLIALKHLFKIDRIRIIAYALYAYGFPLLITVLSISLSNHGYFSNQHCWFTYDNPVIWAFGIPFVLLILGNIYLLILSLHTISRHGKSSDPSTRISFALRDLSTLAIVFGLTWLIGLFYFHQQNTTIISYTFIIFNAVETILVVIYYCLSDKQYHFQDIFNFMRRPIQNDKSHPHYNTSSSGYSSTHSTECHKSNQPSSFPTNPEYLTGMPVGLLSTFRYPTSSTLPSVTPEQNEQLLKRYKLDAHDDHQYYEIG